MIKVARDINSVKSAIKRVKGETVKVKVNLGRNKFVTYEGTLTSVYPSLFTIEPHGEFKGKAL